MFHFLPVYCVKRLARPPGAYVDCSLHHNTLLFIMGFGALMHGGAIKYWFADLYMYTSLHVHVHVYNICLVD